MTLSVHADYDNYAERDDWTEVGRTEWGAQHGQEAFTRIEYARDETTCLKPMRGWSAERRRQDDVTGRVYTSTHTHHGHCLLEKDHKGRHSTVVFYCDGCGKTRRGEAYRSDENVSMCFMCCQVTPYWGVPT